MLKKKANCSRFMRIDVIGQLVLGIPYSNAYSSSPSCSNKTLSHNGVTQSAVMDSFIFMLLVKG